MVAMQVVEVFESIPVMCRGTLVMVERVVGYIVRMVIIVVEPNYDDMYEQHAATHTVGAYRW